mgnify:CR=1 FL=1
MMCYRHPFDSSVPQKRSCMLLEYLEYIQEEYTRLNLRLFMTVKSFAKPPHPKHDTSSAHQ